MNKVQHKIKKFCVDEQVQKRQKLSKTAGIGKIGNHIPGAIKILFLRIPVIARQIERSSDNFNHTCGKN